MVSRTVSVACIFLVFQVLLPLVSCSVTITYQLYSFSNEEKKDWGGNRCDGLSNCDTVFHFCFDKPTNGLQAREDLSNFNICNYGVFTTGEFHDQNSITFLRHDLAGIPNPLTIRLISFPLDGFRMKLLVYDDDDYTGNDPIDRFFYNYTDRVFGWDEAVDESDIVQHYVGSRSKATATSLVAFVKAQCDRFWYGPHCYVYCAEGIPYDETRRACVTPTTPSLSSTLSSTTTKDPNSGAAGNLPGDSGSNGIQHRPVVDAGTNNNVGVHSGDTTGLIIGLVGGIALAILIVIIAIAVIYRYRKKQKLLQSQGVNTYGMESQFDNPAYGEPQHRPSTASTNALIPGGTGTGTQATVATGSQGTQAGFAAGVVMTTPPYMYDNHQQALSTKVQAATATQNAANGAIGGADVYDTPRPTHPPEYQPRAGDNNNDDDTYEAMALPPKTKRY